MKKRAVRSRTENLWPPPPDLPAQVDLDQKCRKLLTGSKSLDALIGLAAGAVPSLLLFFAAEVFELADAASNSPSDISEVKVQVFLASATTFQCLLSAALFRRLPIFRWSNLIAACFTGAYLAGLW